jgi:hypothetical protein
MVSFLQHMTELICHVIRDIIGFLIWRKAMQFVTYYVTSIGNVDGLERLITASRRCDA